MARKPSRAANVPGQRAETPGNGDRVDAHVRSAVSHWPEIDAQVEGIVVRISNAERLMNKAAAASLAQVGLTHEEFKVLIALHDGARSHGALCRELVISTGAMTNRLDKLEASRLVTREPDPTDRRGVLLQLTDQGRARLDKYIELGARRERELLSVLDIDEKKQLNELLGKLVVSLRSELGAPPKWRL